MKVMRRDVYPRFYQRFGAVGPDKAFWIKPPYTELELKFLGPDWPRGKKWPRGYDESWYLTENEGHPDRILESYGNSDNGLMFAGGAPHRPSSLDPTKPALDPAGRATARRR